MKKSREEVKKMVNDMNEMENFERYAKSGLSSEEVAMILDVIRESRLEHFFEEELNIDKDKLEEAKKRTIRLHPESTEWPLLSTLYRDHDGEYKVEDLFNEYHDSILRDGVMVGNDYGEKFLIEDIQNKRFSKEDILNMSEDEIKEYCNEERESI